MEKALGTVVRIENGVAWIETVRQSACGHCASQGSCGTGVLNQLFSARNQLQLPAQPHMKTGDQVVLSLPGGDLLRQALWAYGAPLAGFLAGALLARAVGMAESGMLLGSIAGMAGGWGLMRRFARIEPPVIERVIPAGSENNQKENI